jgi:hypothetical protein
VSTASSHCRNRAQRLQDQGLIAPSSSGSQGLAPRALRPERLSRLNAPGIASRAVCILSRGGPKGNAVMRREPAPGCEQAQPLTAQIAASFTIRGSFQGVDMPWRSRNVARSGLSAARKGGKVGPGCLASSQLKPQTLPFFRTDRLEAEAGTTPPSSSPQPPREPP